MTTWSVLVAVAALLMLFWGLLRLARRAARADWGQGWLNNLDGLNRLFCRYYHGLVYDEIPLPPTGGAIVVANHISGLDPFLLATACRRPLRFMIAREQYERWWLKWFFDVTGCIPVDRKARPEQALRLALAALNRGEVVALFPHGHIHLAHHPPRKLKAGAVRLSRKTGCPIFPARIEGVTGKGLVALAVLLPSRTRLKSFPAMVCVQADLEFCLEELACILNGSR